ECGLQPARADDQRDALEGVIDEGERAPVRQEDGDEAAVLVVAIGRAAAERIRHLVQIVPGTAVFENCTTPARVLDRRDPAVLMLEFERPSVGGGDAQDAVTLMGDTQDGAVAAAPLDEAALLVEALRAAIREETIEAPAILADAVAPVPRRPIGAVALPHI